MTLMVTANQRKFGIIATEQAGVRVIETPDLLWGNLRSGWDLWNLLNRMVYLSQDQEPYDLIHCFETRPATIYPALRHSQRRGIPLVTDWNDWWGRGGLIDEVRPRWYRFLMGGLETYYEEAFRTRAAGLTVISSALARRAEGLGVPTASICHLPGGAFPDFFQPQEKASCCQRFGLDPASPILGFSSLDSHLDLEIVFQALARVAQRYPTVKLIVTGQPAPAILALAKAHAVEANLYLTGFLPYAELPQALGCADFFVLPLADKICNVGRWPNKICDYMSLGRPTISNPVGDIQTLFENHEIGLLAAWQPEDFAEKILSLIEQPALAQKLGENARKLATTSYSWKFLIVQLENFYLQVLNRPQPSAASLA